MAQKVTLRVQEKRELAPSIYEVVFCVEDAPNLTFVPGQNMMLQIAPGVNRTMSIASAPTELPFLRMIHDVRPKGPGSQWTETAAVGEKISVVMPTGGALQLSGTPRRKVLVATGSGIAPFRAVVAFHAGLPELCLYWGLRRETDVYLASEFDAKAAVDPSFSWHLVLSQPGPTWKGYRGHVTEHVLSQEKDGTDSEFYLCGNKAMISDMTAMLLGRNVPKDHIKTELFY